MCAGAVAECAATYADVCATGPVWQQPHALHSLVAMYWLSCAQLLCSCLRCSASHLSSIICMGSIPPGHRCPWPASPHHLLSAHFLCPVCTSEQAMHRPDPPSLTHPAKADLKIVCVLVRRQCMG